MAVCVKNTYIVTETRRNILIMGPAAFYVYDSTPTQLFVFFAVRKILKLSLNSILIKSGVTLMHRCIQVPAPAFC